MNRRELLAGLGCTAVAAASARSWATSSGIKRLHFSPRPGQRLGTIESAFMGLGYEASSVGQTGLFSADNQALIEFYRTLGKRGVVRVGGNTSDYTKWSPDGKAVSAPKATVLNKAVVRDLGGFLKATEWKLIWGLNLGSGTKDEAADEAAFVAESVGDALLAFQIGNEPDLFPKVHRGPGYDYAAFEADFKEYAAAIRARVPSAPFAGPDVAGATDWVARFAHDNAGMLRLLTRHYYAEGPPQSPRTTIENLLAAAPGLERTLGQFRTDSRLSGLPYRIVETNSCYGGGRPGVSNTFASALWVLDYMFTMAAFGCAGANIETGVNQMGWISSYTPIDRDASGVWVARPIFYGMLAFAIAGNGEILGLDYDAQGVNVKAYATRNAEGRDWLTLINKDLTADVEAVIHAGSEARCLRLTAPAADAVAGVQLGGSTVNSQGQWRASHWEKLKPQRGQLKIRLPRVSALLIEM